jgi:hypothetical protein
VIAAIDLTVPDIDRGLVAGNCIRAEGFALIDSGGCHLSHEFLNPTGKSGGFGGARIVLPSRILQGDARCLSAL